MVDLGLLAWLRRRENRTRPVDAESAAAAARRWAELPEHVKTDGQLIGRRSTGCEGTHGVFPACDFSCKPCYHSKDANKVRVDGAHTLEQVSSQMAFLREQRGPAAFAQLIGGEVSLLVPEDQASALETMRANGRTPMSMTHGDFDEEYLHQVVLRQDGSRRFDSVSFAAHIDSTMYGRRGNEKPQSEAELNDHRQRFTDMFARLRSAHGVHSYLAHNMTVTPDNLGEIADVITASRRQGWRMFSFQPAAYIGSEVIVDPRTSAQPDPIRVMLRDRTRSGVSPGGEVAFDSAPYFVPRLAASLAAVRSVGASLDFDRPQAIDLLLGIRCGLTEARKELGSQISAVVFIER